MGKNKATLKLFCNALSRLRHSKGFGIHSPFAFTFVLRVLREKCAYYAYADIESRRQIAVEMSHNINCPTRMVSLKNAKMLFRIACYFNPDCMLQIGTTYGVSTSAVLDVSSTSKIIIYKGTSACDEIFKAVTHGQRGRIIETPSIEDAFSRYDKENDGRRFLMVNSLDDDRAVETCSRHASDVLDKEGIVVVRNLLSDDRVVRFVSNITSGLDHGMTFTNGRLIIIVGLKHLPRQRFNLWF